VADGVRRQKPGKSLDLGKFRHAPDDA
jgi:hypothetical protein